MSSKSDSGRSREPEGRYANWCQVGVSEQEVVIDFGQAYDRKAATFHTRIVTSPIYATQLVRLLEKALQGQGSQRRGSPPFTISSPGGGTRGGSGPTEGGAQ